MRSLLLSSVALGLLCGLAQAHQVYPGCAVPTASTGKVWWIDPVNGKTQAAGGLGTQAAPWNSLKAVAGTKGAIQSGVFGPDVGYTQPLLSTVTRGTGGGTGPIHPGDKIELMSGNYGDVSIGDYQLNIANSDWLTIEAAPGQTPILNTFSISDVNKLLLIGLKVQSQSTAGGGVLVYISDGGAAYPTQDIVIENFQASSADNPVAMTWTGPQMLNYFRSGGIFAQQTAPGATSCVSVTGSHIENVIFGSEIMASQMLFSGNEVDHFGDDGGDYAASNIAITKNYVHDALLTGSGAHMDGFQGYPGTWSNVLIDSNVIIRQMDPALPLPNYLQGIDAFDGDWTNMTVTNNAVVTSACWGMNFESLHDSLVASNTAVYDGNPIGLSGCMPALAVGASSHQGAMSSNTRVSNNIASMIWLWNSGLTGMSIDHNVSIGPIFNGQGINYWAPTGPGSVGGSIATNMSTGSDANGNKVATDGNAEFTKFDNVGMHYDLTLTSTAQSLGAGTTGAPLPIVDINGVTRNAPYAPGAYTPTTATLPPAWRSPVISYSTLNKTITLLGTATAGSTIIVYDGATQIGTMTTPSNFVWTFTTPPLASGVHTFTATETDPGTAPSTPSAPFFVTVP